MKKVIAALALGMLIGSAGSAIAANSETVQATFAKFNFKVNGTEQTLKTDPLVVDGTSYLPVREVAGLLGYELDYDADTRTIDLSNEKDVTPVNQSTAAKVEDESQFDLTQWIALSDIDTSEGVSILVDSKEISIEKGTEKITIALPLERSGEQIAQTNKTPVRLFFSTDATYFNRDDLAKLGLTQ